MKQWEWSGIHLRRIHMLIIRLRPLKMVGKASECEEKVVEFVGSGIICRYDTYRMQC